MKNREAAAALNNVRQLSRELFRLRADYEQLAAAWKGESEAHASAARREAQLRDSLAARDGEPQLATDATAAVAR